MLESSMSDEMNTKDYIALNFPYKKSLVSKVHLHLCLSRFKKSQLAMELYAPTLDYFLPICKHIFRFII